MSAGVLLLTHPGLGAALLRAAQRVLPEPPPALEAVEIPWDAEDAQAQPERVAAALRRLDSGQGVLLLVDLFGSTPGNLAREAAYGRRTRRVHGLNLPMLLRVLNYRHADLDELARIAVEGGRMGVVVDDG